MTAPISTELASLFTDHAILQAGRPCPIWGWDAPGQVVRVRLLAGGGQEVGRWSTEADAAGRFACELDATASGGPYQLLVEGSRSCRIEDVWFGEVWLASGQSNMEWTLASSSDAAREIAEASWPGLRFFKVEPLASQAPRERCAGRWVVCSPADAADFSAVGYAFAREIHRARQTPVGIIDATWGGTRIEAWLSLPALEPLMPELPELRARLESELAELPRLRADYERASLEWQRAHLPADTGNQGLARGWAEPTFDDTGFRELPLPGFWQAHGMVFNGVVWFRRAVELPASWAGHELALGLGALDDFDHTYFDGVEVGRTPPGTLDAHRVLRRYRVPAERVRGGRHVLAVRVFDHFGGGGFAGPASEMVLECPALGERIALSGPWRVAVEREIPLVPMSVFESFPAPPLALAQQHSPAALFQGMTAPLIPYAIRGALWYQGESNVAGHARYRDQMRALICDYRTRWGQGQFPFLYVQLASFRATEGWPRLREAQAEALSEPATGMVVTLDVGDPDDIHPRNKREVGRRLALLARARVYGEPELVHEGPRSLGVDIVGPSARVRFANAAGLGTSDGQPPRGFTLAGADGQHWPAHAVIEGDAVLLTHPRVAAPRAVRYAFSDAPSVNLQNAAGLPAWPFRTDMG
jgi:sialate O-acetylesterase